MKVLRELLDALNWRDTVDTTTDDLPTDFLDWTGTTLPNNPQIPQSQKDPLEIFRRVELESDSKIHVVQDAERGMVWLFEKPAAPSNPMSYRCESNGLVSQGASYESWNEGETYDISWSSMLEDTDSITYGKYVIFQWKSYPEGIQNYPFLFTVHQNFLRMIHSNKEGKWIEIWQGPIESGKWFDVKVRMRLSRDETAGALILFFNGEPQQFHHNRDGEREVADVLVCRTLDEGRGNYPKWGAYNRDKALHAIRHYVDLLRIKRIQ
ncbi:heparin lyase I family protein [Pseudomonas sp. microsymbiont 2]